MTICKKLDTSLYKQDVFLIISSNGKEAGEYINKNFKNIDKSDEDNKCRGFQWKTHYHKEGFEKARFFVYINIKEIGKDKTTIFHEILHLTWDILDHVGITLSSDNHEPQTYLYEHLIKQCLAVIKSL